MENITSGNGSPEVCIKNPIYSGLSFPNGRTREDLLYFLGRGAFGMSQEEFDSEIAWDRAMRALDCHWRCDSDGKMVVDNVCLQDQSVRVVITEEGFSIELKIA